MVTPYMADMPPNNVYTGISNFSGADGISHRVIWRVRRAHRRTKSAGIKKGRIIFMEIRVDDDTTCLWDMGVWYKHTPVYFDSITRNFYKLLTTIYG